MTDNPKQTAEYLIGEEAVRKLQRAHIALVWERDQVVKMVDRIGTRMDTRQLETKLEHAQRWAKLWKRVAKKWYSISHHWYRQYVSWTTSYREQRDEARTLAIRFKRELDDYRDWEKSTLGKALLRVANTDEAYIKLRDDRDDWQKLSLEQSETIENLSQDYYIQDELAGVQAALENWRRRALDAEEKPSRCCETCRHFHAKTYTCKSWAPLMCVCNDYSEWEAMIPRVTSTEAEFDAESADSTTKIT